MLVEHMTLRCKGYYLQSCAKAVLKVRPKLSSTSQPYPYHTQFVYAAHNICRYPLVDVVYVVYALLLHIELYWTLYKYITIINLYINI